ncbi:MAG: hypothetical protein A2W23_00510 [Planctomycetes bacterium RBG_16_43_13]|nr:MAG: hypothetical protein A2W23_00510 [Planctomycetes bacterium RBG_16_43_13]
MDKKRELKAREMGGGFYGIERTNRQNGIERTNRQIGTIYSSNPILPAVPLADELRKNKDFGRKAPLDKDGNIIEDKIDPKELRRFIVNGKKRILSRLCSERSEDLVTFTVFESLNILFKDSKQKHLDIKPLLGGMGDKYKDKIRLRYGERSDTLFWRPDSNRDNSEDIFLKTIKLIEPTNSMGRVIPGKIQYTEIDAIHIKHLDNGKGIITFLDAKLTAKSSICVKKKKNTSNAEKICRLYLDNEGVKQKHCDYWESGPFKQGESLIERYFKNVQKPENRYGEINGEATFCNKYYQLMRNWLFGNVLVDMVAEFKGWDFHLIHIGDINHLQDMTFYTAFKGHLREQGNRTFALTTWQNISSAAFETLGNRAMPLLDWLSNHPVTGSVYGQRNPLFPKKEDDVK